MVRFFSMVAVVLMVGSVGVADDNDVAAKKPSAGEVLTAGLAKGNAEQKPVFLVFGSPGCGWCKIFEKYHSEPAVKELLDERLVLVKVDVVENAGGEELYLKYGKQRGVPAFSLLDADGKVLSDSGDGDANVGFPAAPEEIAGYFDALEKAGVKLSAAEIELLTSNLKKFQPVPLNRAKSVAETKPAEKARPKLYDETADGAKQIDAALASAKKENKRVLLQFGANWCGWCHKLHKLFEENDAIRQELDANFVVVLIDVNENHNEAINKKYENPTRHGLPVIVVLDADGQALTTQDTAKLEEGDHHDPERVMAFLKEWEPKK